MADLTQEEFSSEFGKLLGKLGRNGGDYDRDGKAKQYKKSFAERDDEERKKRPRVFFEH